MNTIKCGRLWVVRALAGALCLAASSASAQTVVDEGFFDNDSGSGAGAAVALWGDTLAVGVPNETGLPAVFGAGAVNIYTRDLENGGWVLFQTLSAPDRGTDHHFGSAVALHDKFLVVGEPGYANGQGRISVFVSSGGFFNYQGNQEGGLASSLGSNVAVARHNSNTPYLVLAGAQFRSPYGGAYASAWEISGEIGEIATLLGSRFINPEDYPPTEASSGLFGRSVAIVPQKCIPQSACENSFSIAIGAPGHDSNTGYATVLSLHTIPSVDDWSFVLNKVATDQTPATGEFFGDSVALDAGDGVLVPPRLVVGAPYATTQPPASITTGAVAIFERPLGGSDWDYVTQRLGPTGSQTGHTAFGAELHLEGDQIWVGAPNYDVPADFGSIVNAVDSRASSRVARERR